MCEMLENSEKFMAAIKMSKIYLNKLQFSLNHCISWFLLLYINIFYLQLIDSNVLGEMKGVI